MAEDKLERIYMVPLGKAYEYKRTNRVPRAVKILRQFVSRHMKAELEEVYLSNALNNVLWTRSIQKPPRRVKVRVVKREGTVRVYLPEEMTEDEKKSKKEADEKAAKDKAEKEKKEKEAKEKKPEVKPVASKPAPAPEKKPEAKPELPKPEEKKPEAKPAASKPAPVQDKK